MILGNGTIGSVLTDREDRLYFASGVSNSSETRRSEYEREKNLLLEQDRHRHLVYFSTLSVFYSDSLYVQHKKRMEKLIKERFKTHTIMRLGNPTWGKNPVHLIPFLKKKLENNEPLDVWDVYRYPLELKDFLHWVSLIPPWSCEMNVYTSVMKVNDILEHYVRPMVTK